MSYPQRVGNKRTGKLTGKFFGEVDLRGKRFRRLCDTKPEADGYEAYVKATGAEPAHEGGTKHTGVTFREVAELCKAAGGPRKAKWKRGRDPSLHQRLEFVVERLGELDVAAVGALELDKLVADLQRRPGYQGRALASSTINRYLAAASAVLTFAASRGFIQGAPTAPYQDETGAREAVVSPELERALWGWLTEHGYHGARLCYQVLIETGMRAGELDQLEAAQIANEWITLRASQTKTDAQRRVWIAPELARDFRALVASGLRPNARHLRTIFKRAVKSVGGSPELVIHSLRHTRATRLLEAGTPSKLVMEMLGWTAEKTLHRYQHVNGDMHAEAAKKVSLRVGGSAENSVVLPFTAKTAV